MEGYFAPAAGPFPACPNMAIMDQSMRLSVLESRAHAIDLYFLVES